MGAFLIWIVGCLLRRRCVMTLNNGRKVRWVRPPNVSAETYYDTVKGWTAARGQRIDLMGYFETTCVMSHDIVSFTIR